MSYGSDGPRRVLFVAGVSRSGSTALDFILANRPDGFSLGEIYAWYRPFRDHHIDPQCTCGLKWYACPLWRRVGHPKARHLHRRVADALAVHTVVDSSKRLSWIRDALRWADADGLETHVVLSWRPPQAIAYSYWKRGGGAPENPARTQASKPSWMTNLEGYVRRLESLGVGYHVVPFDQLLSDPATTLDQLHAGIGMEAWPGQERFWEGEYHSMFGSGGTKEQLQAQSGKLAEPQVSPEFFDYWHGLPASWREGLEELDATVLGIRRRPSSSRRLPPPWYVRNRLATYQQEFVLRSRNIATRLRGRVKSL